MAVGDALSGVHFGHPVPEHGQRVDVADDPVLSMAADQITEYFDGARTGFDLPLHLAGTPFQIEAWRALECASFATTMTYSEQAASIGRPRAVRAIGAANSRNPVAIVLPCHRVVGADGTLTGYAGGLDIKRWLLDHEASVVRQRQVAGMGTR